MAISQRDICAALRGAAADYRVECLEQAASTNELVIGRAKRGERAGLVIVAGQQSAGRGRLGRSFHSPPVGGLYMSLLLRPSIPAEHALEVTTAAAVAGCRACERLGRPGVGIKWVNDLFLEGRKICGILTEAALTNDGGLAYAVLGIGMNLSPPRAGFPPELDGIAGTLFSREEPGLRERAAAELLNAFAELCDGIGTGAHTGEYRARSLVIGREVDILGGPGGRATVLDVDDRCRLIAARPNGERLVLSSGEISIRM